MSFSFERALDMYKAGALIFAVTMAVMASGCAMVGRHTGPVENGKKTTVGLLSFDSVGDGYPMIPFYSNFEHK